MLERKKRNPSCGMGKMPASAKLANSYVPFQSNTPQRYEPGFGLVRGTIYPGLDLPFMGMVNKKPLPSTPLSELQTIGFAVQELALYLDTHRDDAQALELYQSYQKLYHDKSVEYGRRYGPMSHLEPTSGQDYTWLSDPWPWEYHANREG